MKKERLHTAINDAELSLHRLARLIPGLSSPRTLSEVLQLIHDELGARLAWIVLESDGDQHLEISGDPPHHKDSAQCLLNLLQQQQTLWRVKCWHSDVGKLLYSEDHPLAHELECGVLCRILPLQENSRAFLFMAFDQPLLSPAVLRSVAIIITEKLRDYITELISQKRTAWELQQIVSQYRMLFDHAPVLMNSFDKDNRCTLWNGECERVFGWTLEEINQQPDPLALFYPDLEVRRRVRESVNFSPTLEMHEWYPCRRDGAVLATLWSNIMLPDGEILNIGVDITERKRVENLLTLKATTDALTGCFNRPAILEQLQHALTHCQAENRATHFTLVMIDLDHFKHINDRWGHIVGDEVLVYFCQSIREQCGESARLGRLGGEEFLLLLPLTDSLQAIGLSDQIRVQLQRQPFLLGEVAITLSFSGGAIAVCHHNHEPAVLLTLADNALYDAKRTGRGKTLAAIAP